MMAKTRLQRKELTKKKKKILRTRHAGEHIFTPKLGTHGKKISHAWLHSKV